MTPRGSLRLTRAQFEALSSFARGYLHEEAVVEYGDAAGAARAFAADASDDDRWRVAAALDALDAAARGRPPASLQRFLSRQVRCAWRPENVGELRTMAAAIRGVTST